MGMDFSATLYQRHFIGDREPFTDRLAKFELGRARAFREICTKDAKGYIEPNGLKDITLKEAIDWLKPLSYDNKHIEFIRDYFIAWHGIDYKTLKQPNDTIYFVEVTWG